MASSKVVLTIALLAAITYFSQAAPTSSPVEDIYKKFVETYDKVKEDLKKQGISFEEGERKFNDVYKEFTKEFNDVYEKAKKDPKAFSEEVQKQLQKSFSNVSQTIEKLKSKETSQKAEKLFDSFSQAFKKSYEQGVDFFKSVTA